MSVVQGSYETKAGSNVRQTVWLAIDVPGMATKRIPDLEQAMREFATQWIADDKTSYSEQYASGIGVAEAKKLRIFVQER